MIEVLDITLGQVTFVTFRFDNSQLSESEAEKLVWDTSLAVSEIIKEFFEYVFGQCGIELVINDWQVVKETFYDSVDYEKGIWTVTIEYYFAEMKMEDALIKELIDNINAQLT